MKYFNEPFFHTQSNGDLENEERIGAVILKMLKMANKQELGLGKEDTDSGFHRLTSKINLISYLILISQKNY